MTKYTVLVKKTDGSWDEKAEQQAPSSAAAIRAYIHSFNGTMPEGEFVAVPSRSWQPVTVKVERTVKIG